MTNTYYVYILASKRNGTLCVGVTNNLERRMYEHKMHLVSGFTDKYNITLLVWYEMTSDIFSAIKKEKEIKKWNRAWKLRLIEEQNQKWEDLSKDFSGFPPARE
ncbi:MAG: GIY-YIG nuclease family protein [Parcubacteria group bacterium]|nr:GIY-YIG nuclease family protein [Parcubacteria group bacterium]